MSACMFAYVCLLLCVYSMSLCMSVCVWMRLKGGCDMKMDGVCMCICFSFCVYVDLFDDADPIYQLLH